MTIAAASYALPGKASNIANFRAILTISIVTASEIVINCSTMMATLSCARDRLGTRPIANNPRPNRLQSRYGDVPMAHGSVYSSTFCALAVMLTVCAPRAGLWAQEPLSLERTLQAYEAACD